MEQVDNTIIPIITQLGCKLPVQSISEFNSEYFFSACSAILRGINSKYNFPPALSKATAARYRECTKVAEAITELGYTSELGYNAFLYPEGPDMRKLLMWLVDKLPKVDDAKEADEVVGGGPSIEATIRTALSEWTRELWSPHSNKLPCHSVSTVPLAVPRDKEPSAEVLKYWTKYQPLVTQQAPQHSMLAPSLFELNTREIILAQQKEKEWDVRENKDEKANNISVVITEAFRSSLRTQGGTVGKTDSSMLMSAYSSETGTKPSSAFGRRVDFGQDRKTDVPTPAAAAAAPAAKPAEAELSAEAKEEIARQEREAKIEALRQQLQALREKRARYDAKIEEDVAMTRTIEGDLTEEDQKTGELEKGFKVKKRTIDLLPNAQENMQKLQEMADGAAQKLVDLAQQWEEHRGPLLAKYRKQKAGLADKKQDVGTKVDLIKRMRAEMKEKAQDIKEKDAIYAQAAEELSKMPKGVNRQVYVRRIMEIVKNLEKQKLEISKVLQDVHQVQKDINSLSQKAKRSFDVVDEIVFQAAKDKKDPVATQTYRNVVDMRDAFVDLVKGVEEVGKLKNESRDISSSIQALEARNTNQNMDQVQKDLSQVQEENKKLTSQIKKIREPK